MSDTILAVVNRLKQKRAVIVAEFAGLDQSLVGIAGQLLASMSKEEREQTTLVLRRLRELF